MSAFATIEDLNTLWRPLKLDEEERASALLDIVSDSLRYEAEKVHEDLDLKKEKSKAFENVLKSVTVDVVSRTLMTSSGMGYSFSGSYLVPGGGLFIKKSELSRLGLRKQKYGVIDFYGTED